MLTVYVILFFLQLRYGMSTSEVSFCLRRHLAAKR